MLFRSRQPRSSPRNAAPARPSTASPARSKPIPQVTRAPCVSRPTCVRRGAGAPNSPRLTCRLRNRPALSVRANTPARRLTIEAAYGLCALRHRVSGRVCPGRRRSATMADRKGPPGVPDDPPSSRPALGRAPPLPRQSRSPQPHHDRMNAERPAGRQRAGLQRSRRPAPGARQSVRNRPALLVRANTPTRRLLLEATYDL